MLPQRAQWSELSGGISSLRTALAPGWGALPSSPAGLEAVCPGQQQHDEFTLEIPRSSHPGAGNGQAGECPGSSWHG